MENEDFSLEAEGAAVTAASEEERPPTDADASTEGADQTTEATTEASTDSCPPGDDYASLAEADLTALRAAFPALSGMASVAELPEAERYGELREAGLAPIEAFCASHHKILIPRKEDNRAHLSASIGRTASVGGTRIGAAALTEARDLFPSLSDREIEALYRRVTSAK